MRTIIGVIAECKDCSWRDDNYLTVTKTARVHAKKTGHEVIVETTSTHTYNDKSKREQVNHKKTLIVAANYSAAKTWAYKNNVHNWEYIDYPEKLKGISSKDFCCVSLYGWWNNLAAEEWNRWIERTDKDDK